MLELNIGMLVGWFVGCFVVGFVGSWLTDKYKKRKGEVVVNDGASFGQVTLSRDTDHNTMPKLRVGVIEAMNGRILEINTAIPNNHNHYDWKIEMYVVPEGQKLSEAIAVVMLMKGLEK
jgi:hypothetical protein